MKKLVLLLAVAFSATMFSCGGGQKEMSHQDSIDSGLIVVAEEVVAVAQVCDSCACDTCACDTTCVAAVAETVVAE